MTNEIGHYMEAVTSLRVELHDARIRLDERAKMIDEAETRGQRFLDEGRAAVQERDENFGTIKTICKVLCDLDCENGCDEGLEYEGDEWCPCPCIYRHKTRAA